MMSALDGFEDASERPRRRPGDRLEGLAPTRLTPLNVVGLLSLFGLVLYIVARVCGL
jgi:hypothetical protein